MDPLHVLERDRVRFQKEEHHTASCTQPHMANRHSLSALKQIQRRLSTKAPLHHLGTWLHTTDAVEVLLRCQVLPHFQDGVAVETEGWHCKALVLSATLVPFVGCGLQQQREHLRLYDHNGTQTFKSFESHPCFLCACLLALLANGLGQHWSTLFIGDPGLHLTTGWEVVASRFSQTCASHIFRARSATKKDETQHTPTLSTTKVKCGDLLLQHHTAD